MPRRGPKNDEVVGRRWALLLMALVLAGLALAAWMTRLDRLHRDELDSFSKSTQPLPTPAAKSDQDEEMDPDKDEK